MWLHTSMLTCNSPGLRPNDVSGSFEDGLVVKGSYFQLCQGARPVQKLHLIDWPKSLSRSLGAPRLDFLDLSAHREGVTKIVIF